MALPTEKLEALCAQYPEIADKIRAADQAHPEIDVVPTKLGPAIFRRPQRIEYKRHLGMIFDEKKRADAAEYLASVCVVFPERAGFLAWLEEAPGIPLAAADVLSAMAGAAKKEDEGK